MTGLLRGLLPALAAGVALVSLQVSAQEAFSPAQRQAIEGIVKDYLVKNPEVLQEAINELEKRTAETQKRTQQAALTEVRQTLLTSPHGNVVGSASGDVTLIEFFDYNCGYCKKSLADIRALIKSDPRLKVVLRDLPVLGPDSLEASRVALAAKQQLSSDKLFEYHARLIESRGRVGAERAFSLAKEMGLDMARLQRDLSGADVKAAMAENMALSDKLGLTGTPAFVVGDEVISGAVGVDPLRQAIGSIRKCGHAVC